MKNKAIATVGDNIRRQDEILERTGVNHILEWNEGNHFKEAEIRTSKGFAWCVNQVKGRG